MRGTYHHGDLRAAFLDAARALAHECGIDGFSMREASRRAGVSHTAVYNHFADKAALVEALVDDAFASLRRALERAERREASPLDRLQNVGVAYVRFAFRHPAEFRYMFRPEHYRKVGLPSDETNANDDAYHVLARTVRACEASGAIAPDTSAAVALTAWCLVHGLATLILDGPNPALARTIGDAERLARTVTATAMVGRSPLQ